MARPDPGTAPLLAVEGLRVSYGPVAAVRGVSLAVRAGDLAYGDQRRLELARALATGPRLLMLDEPAAGMDGTETRSLLRLIETVREHFGVAVVVVEHDMDLIMNLCERIQVLAHGELIFEGTPTEVQASPRVRETYLGHA